MSGLALAGVTVWLPVDDEESAVALPRSEFSLGICTLSCGRFEAVDHYSFVAVA